MSGPIQAPFVSVRYDAASGETSETPGLTPPTAEAVGLLPCPFCGSEGEELGRFCDPAEGHDNSGLSRRIQCYGCNIEAPFYDTEAEAIAAWNRRALSAVPDDGLGAFADAHTHRAPDGWALVPKEPSAAMCSAGYKAWNDTRATLPSIIYKAMLQAAPSPSIPTGDAEGAVVGWRLLMRGDTIQRGDQSLRDDCETWGELVGWEVGATYSPAVMVPIRRARLAYPATPAGSE